MDSKDFQRGPFTVTVTVQPDPDWIPEPDGDGYTAKQAAAYEAGDWYYTVLIATACLEGVELGSASLGLVEAGWFVMTDEDDNVTGEEFIDPLAKVEEWYRDLLDEAIEEARAKLAALKAHNIDD